jgi:hypothetical protein
MFMVTSEKTMRAPEERHQGTVSDAAPPELITFPIRYHKHWAPPEPKNWPNSRALRSSARSLAQGVKPWEYQNQDRQPCDN